MIEKSVFSKHDRHAIFWKVRDSNNVLRGFLLGSMHVSMSAVNLDFQSVFRAIDQCSFFSTEIAMDRETQQALSSHYLLPDNNSLTELISPKKIKKMKILILKSFDLDITQFLPFLPIILLNSMTQKVLIRSSKSVSMDYELWNYALAKGKECSGLETIKDHKGILKTMHIDFQTKMLINAISNTKKFRRSIRHLHSIYQQQNIHKLFKMSKKNMGQYRNLMLTSRNQKMLQSFVKLSDESATFAVFGAAHLSGKNGILHQLKTRGYILTPLPLEYR